MPDEPLKMRSIIGPPWSSSNLTDWQSYDQLREWVDANVMIFLKQGVEWTADPRFDCDDYAMRLRDIAAEDGFYLSLQLTADRSHMGNLAIVNGEMYWVDPTTTEIFYWGTLD